MEGESMTGNTIDVQSENGDKLPVLQTGTAIAVSLVICKIGSYATKVFGIQGGSLPAITAIIVVLATVFPKQFSYLAPSGEVMAFILMQVSYILVLILLLSFWRWVV